jgi:transketolase
LLGPGTAPILWAALKEAGAIQDDLLTLRLSTSLLEGHPTPRSPWIRVTTGSLGQGLSAAAGMAWARKLDASKARVYHCWATASAPTCAPSSTSTGLGQSGPTMYGHDMGVYEARFKAFWLGRRGG